MDVYATGPNAIFGKIGHLMIIVSFVAALISSFSYGKVTLNARRSNKIDISGWISLGRIGFLLHSLAVFCVIALLLFMIRHHLFEYSYVWRSSNESLPMRFLLASFWEGQEGSTLLWMFWHVIIGIVLIFKAREWEPPVLMTVSLAQAMLASMVLGIIVFGHKYGASPFVLLRDTMDAPIFKMNPTFIPQDGNGLNPLLQNYWMTIHPPTLFFGYALTIVPFAYALASLINRSYTDWVKPVFPWVLATVLVLSIGVLMGGAWAYEALSFGGFWAWDPVENASLVPWLIMVAGLHVLLAYRYTGHSLPASYLMFFGSFTLVLYSSFLTKSGILGESSVHSFTDMGMSLQLVVMLAIFLLPPLLLLIYRWNDLPFKKKEEALSSREFWLFIGSMVFVISAIHISFFTSASVFNKILGTKMAPPADAVGFYNRIQIWVAIMIGILLAIGQFFNYRHSSPKGLRKTLAVPLILSILIAVPIIVHYKFYRINELLLVFASVFGILANVFYIILRLKKKVSLYGPSLSHSGFAMLLLGIIISQGRQHVVSYNQFGDDYGINFSERENEENILLYQNEPSSMSNYVLTYLGDSVTEHSVYYKVRYQPVRGKKGKSFTLKPHLQMDPNMGTVANPSTKRTLSKDLYTHITAAPVTTDGRSTVTQEHIIKVGDTIKFSSSIAILDTINPSADPGDLEVREGDIAVGAQIRYLTLDSNYMIEPIYLIQNRIARSIPIRVEGKEITFIFTKILPETEEIEMTVVQKFPPYIIMKAIIFPFINLVWAGALIMAIGIMISISKRLGKTA